MLIRKVSKNMPPGLFHTRTSNRMLPRRKNAAVFFYEPSREGGLSSLVVPRKPSRSSEQTHGGTNTEGSSDLQSLLDQHAPSIDSQTYLPHISYKFTPDSIGCEDSGSIGISEGTAVIPEKGCRILCRRIYHKFNLRHVIPLIILTLYSLIGASLFYALEVPLGKEIWSGIRGRVQEARRIVYERIWELHELNLTRETTLDYAHIAINWYEDQVAEDRIAAGKAIWDFWSAIFYCATIYTTIGYGTIVPITTAGKVLTMLYSIIGIPLVFSILNDFGEFFSKTLFKSWMWVTNTAICLKCCRKEEVHKTKQQEDDKLLEGNDEDTCIMERLHELPLSAAFGVTLLWMFLCAALFCTWETDWGYFTAFYFFFVSLTTIGLGDTVPKHLNYMILNFWCVLVGLALVSMCIQVAQAKVEHLVQEILFGISKKYQQVQAEGGEIMPSLDLDRTINQHPPWMRALIGRQKRGRIKNEWSLRAKMRVKYTQTDELGESHEVQTEEVTEWSGAFTEQRRQLSKALGDLNVKSSQLRTHSILSERYAQALHTIFTSNVMLDDDRPLSTVNEESPIHDDPSPLSPVSPFADRIERRKAVLFTVQSLLADTPLSEVASLPTLPFNLLKVPPSYSEVILNNNNPSPRVLDQPAFETRRKAPLQAPLNEGSSLLSEVQHRIQECRKILSERD